MYICRCGTIGNAAAIVAIGGADIAVAGGVNPGNSGALGMCFFVFVIVRNFQ